MYKSHNQLNPAEVERLSLLAEECGEVVQAVGKILRHGYESYNPKDPDQRSNRELLEIELGDIRASVNLLVQSGDLDEDNLRRATTRKQIKVRQFLHHQNAIVNFDEELTLRSDALKPNADLEDPELTDFKIDLTNYRDVVYITPSGRELVLKDSTSYEGA